MTLILKAVTVMLVFIIGAIKMNILQPESLKEYNSF